MSIDPASSPRLPVRFALECPIIQYASVSFRDALDGLSGHISDAPSPSFARLFSSLVMRWRGAATNVASTICPATAGAGPSRPPADRNAIVPAGRLHAAAHGPSGGQTPEPQCPRRTCAERMGRRVSSRSCGSVMIAAGTSSRTRRPPAPAPEAGFLMGRGG